MPLPNIQEKIEIEEIKDGVVILKNKALRAVLMTSSVNFALKSTEEQDALTYQYQGFLNSLDFPIQISIISRKFDLSDYLFILEQKQKEQENELLRIQTTEYIDFIRGLTQLANIITETFFIIIPFSPIETKEMGFLEKLTSIFGAKKQKAVEAETSFQQLKSQLWQRVNYIISGSAAFGIRAVALNNQELIELYYSLYNPEAKGKPKITH